MKIHKAFAPFICAFFISPLFSNASGIRFVNFDEALHSEYKSNENESGSFNNLVINELVNPYANSNPIPTTQLNQLNHIATSVGNENPVKVCEDEFLIIYSTFTSSNVEYVFKRIRGGNETIVQGRSSNYKLDLDPLNPAFTDYQDGDIYFIEIFDYSTTPTQNLISSQITIEVLTLPTGLSSFDGGTIEQQDQIICSEGIPETLTTSETVNLNFTYQWEYSLDNGNTFNEIQGANNFSLIFSSVVTQTTTYRRSTRWTAGGSCIKYTNEHLVTVIDVEPGKIVVGSNIPTICYGETPPLMENISLGATNAGNLSYEWQTSPDGINWTDTGSTSINYQQSQTLTKTSYFRRKAIQSGGGNTCVIFTDTVTITVPRFSFVYQLQIDSRTYLLPSITFGYWNKTFNGEGLIFEDQINSQTGYVSPETDDPAGTQLGTSNYIDFGASFLLHSESFYVGLSLAQINQPDISISGETPLKANLKLSLQGGAEWDINPHQRNGLPERSYLFIFNNIRYIDKIYSLNLSQEFQFNEFSLGVSQKASMADKFALNGMGLGVGLTLESFDIGMQYYFPLNKSPTNFTSNVFELYLIFEFTPFRRNRRGSFKRLQINNY
ncbi:MAG: type IX secretion system membrane protein PorP/SprF [Flavobacteriaceae bacterium]|nr:type IX secretion system membrane protein PorP/SprF [Flavobacteriaceae bacterium]